MLMGAHCTGYRLANKQIRLELRGTEAGGWNLRMARIPSKVAAIVSAIRVRSPAKEEFIMPRTSGKKGKPTPSRLKPKYTPVREVDNPDKHPSQANADISLPTGTEGQNGL